ncbi:MAG TPA: type II toxin-antitoxin system VapC family toxin [Usitatibacter sp.]|nr:type II toxin-antitoxin system VapC family toxin [Usitatibacter sp.]
MIVLDTNVVSELMRPQPSPEVLDWFAGQPPQSLYVSSVTVAEVLHGVLLLPAGKRRNAILAAARSMFEVEFEARILPFDAQSAYLYAELLVERRRDGRPISSFDAQIAAITAGARAALATRNVGDFQGCGLKLVNPWDH